jgi:hypothetical protein
MNDGRERQFLGLAGVAVAAVFVALFCPWFHISTSTISRAHGGFELAFRPGTQDAWTTIAVFAPLLAVCAIASATGRVARVIGPSLAAIIATFGSVLAVALIAFVLVNPPTAAQTIGSGGEFTRSIGLLSAPHRQAPLPLAWGGFAALGFAGVGGAAVIAELALSRRRPTEGLTPAWVLALSLFVAVIGAGIYACGWAQAWMPNVVVGSLTVGFTITVVEAALQRAERRRQQPRLDVAMRAINSALYYFLLSAANSYARTNVLSFVEVLPDDFLGWVRLLIDELPNSDESRYVGYPGRPPQLQLAVELRSNLDVIADRDREILDPGLAAAIGEFHDEVEVLIELAQQARLNAVPNADGQLYECMSRALREVADFAETYFDSGPPVPPELMVDMNASARNYQQQRRQALGA